MTSARGQDADIYERAVWNSPMSDRPLGDPTMPLWTKMWVPEHYEGLDPGIRFAVKVLHANGIETGQSCEGGDGHAYDRPTVDLAGGVDGSEGFAALHYLSQYGLPVQDIAMLWDV